MEKPVIVTLLSATISQREKSSLLHLLCIRHHVKFLREMNETT
jgi:hypothetical protein